MHLAAAWQLPVLQTSIVGGPDCSTCDQTIDCPLLLLTGLLASVLSSTCGVLGHSFLQWGCPPVGPACHLHPWVPRGLRFRHPLPLWELVFELASLPLLFSSEALLLHAAAGAEGSDDPRSSICFCRAAPRVSITQP